MIWWFSAREDNFTSEKRTRLLKQMQVTFTTVTSRRASKEPRYEQARQRLRAAGLRVTTPRTLVLSELLSAGRPLRAVDLIESASPQGIDAVTVYRILDTLTEVQLARAVETAQRGRRFEVCSPKAEHGDHPHLQCRHCGMMTCLESSALHSLSVPAMLSGFQVEHVNLCFTGVCVHCQQSVRSDS